MVASSPSTTPLPSAAGSSSLWTAARAASTLRKSLPPGPARTAARAWAAAFRAVAFATEATDNKEDIGAKSAAWNAALWAGEADLYCAALVKKVG